MHALSSPERGSSCSRNWFRNAGWRCRRPLSPAKVTRQFFSHWVAWVACCFCPLALFVVLGNGFRRQGRSPPGRRPLLPTWPISRERTPRPSELSLGRSRAGSPEEAPVSALRSSNRPGSGGGNSSSPPSRTPVASFLPGRCTRMNVPLKARRHLIEPLIGLTLLRIAWCAPSAGPPERHGRTSTAAEFRAVCLETRLYEKVADRPSLS